MAEIGDYNFTTVKIYKISYTCSRQSLDRLTVETSFISGFAISQALPVKIGLKIVLYAVTLDNVTSYPRPLSSRSRYSFRFCSMRSVRYSAPSSLYGTLL